MHQRQWHVTVVYTNGQQEATLCTDREDLFRFLDREAFCAKHKECPTPYEVIIKAQK